MPPLTLTEQGVLKLFGLDETDVLLNIGRYTEQSYKLIISNRSDVLYKYYNDLDILTLLKYMCPKRFDLEVEAFTIEYITMSLKDNSITIYYSYNYFDKYGGK